MAGITSDLGSVNGHHFGDDSLGHQHIFHDHIAQVGTKKHIERVLRANQRLSRAAQTGVKEQAMTGKALERTEQLVEIRI